MATRTNRFDLRFYLLGQRSSHGASPLSNPVELMAQKAAAPLVGEGAVGPTVSVGFLAPVSMRLYHGFAPKQRLGSPASGKSLLNKFIHWESYVKTDQ